MSVMAKLVPAVGVVIEKCINCYACITACPVKYCMDVSEERLTVNHDLCVGCGNCIALCHHGARVHIDDTEQFYKDIEGKTKMVAIVAPAIVSVFPKSYLKLNTYLHSIGVKAVFDVSFGAELTVVSYLNYIKKNNPRLVIAQPCPAIVDYIEIYHPELIPYLAPVDSPMLHTIKMIKEYYPQFADHKIVVISPCIAKKREFIATGLGDYNVTMFSLKEYFERNRINLVSYADKDYMGAPAERAVTFSSPGGLLDTIERFSPGIRRKTRKIEGVHAIYPYLTSVSRQLKNPNTEFPLIIDCLNCEHGCNGGPGTGNHHKSMDELESPIRKRSAELEKRINPKQQAKEYQKYHKVLNRFWKENLYNRKYKDISGNNYIKTPSKSELQEIYKKMLKYTKADLYECTACGYGSCESMAIAIFNNLNKPENCAHRNFKLLGEEKKSTLRITEQLADHINSSFKAIESINALVEKLNKKVHAQSQSVNESSAVTEEMVVSLKSTSEFSRQKSEAVTEILTHASKSQKAMTETVQAVKTISESVDGIGAAIKIISSIASKTNLLSMNAAIEAARAGETGKGFTVVSEEIRGLSDSTSKNSRNISQTLSTIIGDVSITSKHASDAGNLIDSMAAEITDFAAVMSELIDTLSKLSLKSSGVTDSLKNLKESSDTVITDYSKMLKLSNELSVEINALVTLSAEITKAIESDNHEIIVKAAEAE